MKQLTIREAADFLLRNDNYVLLTHRRPDGDTIGSAAALCAGLRSLGKTAHVLENPQFTEKFRPWLGKLTCETLPSSACVVSVDIAAENLLPFDLPDCAVELQIDHHAGNRQFGLQAFVDASAAACGEIILRLLQLMGVKLDASMGAALYVAISTDTGCFRFNNTTADTLRCAAACKDTGADTFAINTALFMTKRLPRLQLEARLTEKMEFYAGGAVAVNTLPNVLLVELGLTEDDVDDISGFSREIAGVEIGVMLREGPDGGKISLRCSPKYDAAAICARLGGGGHRGAAGASVPRASTRPRRPFCRPSPTAESSSDGKRDPDRRQAGGLDVAGRRGQAARGAARAPRRATAERSIPWPRVCCPCSSGGRRAPSSSLSMPKRRMRPFCASAL